MVDTFTPEQISQILEEFFKVVGTRRYVGERYVPIFGRKGEESIAWDNSAPYEPLTIVLYQGNSYTSRQYVPIGVDITNQEFWVITGNYNAQTESAITAANNAQNDIDTLLPKVDFSAENTVKKYIDENPTRILTFDTVADMQAATDLLAGMTCHTNGFHASGDGGAAYYNVSASGTANGMDVLALQGGLFATLIIIEPYVTPEMFGAYGNGIDDDTTCLTRAMNYIIDNPQTSLCCNGKYIVTRIKVFPVSTFTIYGVGTFKRKDSIITGDGDRILSIHASGSAKITVEGLTFDGNREGQSLGDSYGYKYEHCHSLAVYPVSSGASVVYRDLKTIGRVGDGINVSSEQRFTFSNVLFENISGRDLGIMRGDCGVTAECENLTFNNCDVGHLETELNVATTEPYVIKCDNCTVDEWLELGSWNSPLQQVYISNTTLKNGVLQLYGNIYATNCNFTVNNKIPEILMYGGIISYCTFVAKDTVNYIRCFRSDNDAIQPSIHFDNCVFVKETTGVLIGANISNTAMKCRIENCIFTGGDRFVNFRGGTLELVNNTVYNATLLNTTATPNSGSTYRVLNNTIFSDAPMINMALPSASDTWEIDFKCTGNKIYTYKDYFSTAYTSRIRSTMLFNDIVYADVDPTTPIKGSIYIEPNGVIKIAQGFTASSLKTFTLS